jgi:hypothetical protein
MSHVAGPPPKGVQHIPVPGADVGGAGGQSATVLHGMVVVPSQKEKAGMHVGIPVMEMQHTLIWALASWENSAKIKKRKKSFNIMSCSSSFHLFLLPNRNSDELKYRIVLNSCALKSFYSSLRLAFTVRTTS